MLQLGKADHLRYDMAGPPSRSRNARQIALSIPELLEAILLGLDMVTLLVAAPRVSRIWNAAIRDSPAIQQALYFRPVAAAALVGTEHSSDSATPGEGSGARPEPVFNPLLVAKFGPCFFDFGETYGRLRRAGSFYRLPWTSSTREPAADEAADRRRFTRRCASWRRMLVSQPPPPCLGYLSMRLTGSAEAQKVSRTLLPPTQPGAGLRMAELYDIVQHLAGHHELYSLWFRVSWHQPQGFFVTKLNERVCAELLLQAGGVVEFYHIDDDGFANNPRQPADPELFDCDFRSADFHQLDIVPEVQRAEEFEDPGWAAWQNIW